MVLTPVPLRFWQILFVLLVAGYCLYYAPYGINETDGGFLTGLAWQLINGKVLYADVVYVRPPLPVWLRALELKLLPDSGAVLAERWIFYLKVALYSWLGGQVLSNGVQRWILTVFGFVLSVHCYPAAGWHTVDGVLFGALSIWSWTRNSNFNGAILSGVFMLGCVLCKQSFYPMLPVWAILLISGQTKPDTNRQRLKYAVSAFGLVAVLFGAYLYSNGLFASYASMTGSSASGGQALQHGIIDYFRINPLVALGSAGCLFPFMWWVLRRRGSRAAFYGWVFFLLFLAGSYVFAIFQRQEFTLPYAQTRLLFLGAAVWGGYMLKQKVWSKEQTLRFFSLLALSWCAALSWGYNLPVLFSTPWVFAAFEISRTLFSAAFPGRTTSGWQPVAFVLLLLFTFRYGYEFVYRDGRRGNMTEFLGDVFPALRGIYSDRETVDLYRELKTLAQQYGPDIKTLPSFPLANFLTKTHPPLPLDWVVEREMQGGKNLVVDALAKQKPVLLIEKGYAQTLRTDPDLAFTLDQLQRGRIIRETVFFWVVLP